MKLLNLLAAGWHSQKSWLSQKGNSGTLVLIWRTAVRWAKSPETFINIFFLTLNPEFFFKDFFFSKVISTPKVGLKFHNPEIKRCMLQSLSQPDAWVLNFLTLVYSCSSLNFCFSQTKILTTINIHSPLSLRIFYSKAKSELLPCFILGSGAIITLWSTFNINKIYTENEIQKVFFTFFLNMQSLSLNIVEYIIT